MKYLTTKEAAEKLNYASDAIVRQMIQKKKIDADKLGHVWMISEKELEKFKTKRRTYNKKKV